MVAHTASVRPAPKAQREARQATVPPSASPRSSWQYWPEGCPGTAGAEVLHVTVKAGRRNPSKPGACG